MSLSNLCRGCGKKHKGGPKTPISDIAPKSVPSVSYKYLIEKSIESKLSSEKSLPQTICENCRNQLELTASLAILLKDNQEDLLTSSNIKRAIAQVAQDYQEEEVTKQPPPEKAVVIRKRGAPQKAKVKVSTK